MTRHKQPTRPTHTDDGDPLYEDARGWYTKYDDGSIAMYVMLKPAAEAEFYRRTGNVVAFTRPGPTGSGA